MEKLKFNNLGQWTLAKAKTPTKSIATQHGEYSVKSHDTNKQQGEDDRWNVWHHEVSHGGKKVGNFQTGYEAGHHVLLEHDMDPKHEKNANSMAEQMHAKMKQSKANQIKTS